MKTGVFGGTFDPIHNGHIRALENFISFACLDRVFVFPAGIPPHKRVQSSADSADRLEMTRIAVADIAEVDDYEIKKDGKSYTVETLEYLKEKYPCDEFYLYVGSDMLRSFDRIWYRCGDILNMAVLTALSRTGEDIDTLKECAAELEKKYGARVKVGEFEPIATSSTEIRSKIASGEDVSGLIAPGVLEYIRKKGLYGGHI